MRIRLLRYPVTRSRLQHNTRAAGGAPCRAAVQVRKYPCFQQLRTFDGAVTVRRQKRAVLPLVSS